MESSTGSFLSGVALALAGFVIKEAATTQMKTYRLRKVLIADAESTVSGLTAHGETLPTLAKAIEDGGAPSFIWEGQDSGAQPPFLADVPIHLSPTETKLALDFYAAQGRIAAIRDEFNGAVRGIVTDPTNGPSFGKIAKACVHDLQRNYVEACATGNSLAAELKARLWQDDYDG